MTDSTIPGAGLFPFGTVINDVPGSPMDGDRGHWAWFDLADPLTHYPYWVPDLAPDVKQRRTARDGTVELRTAQTEQDGLIDAFRAIASPTLAQSRRFSADIAVSQARINKIFARIALRLLDAGDGLETETPSLVAASVKTV